MDTSHGPQVGNDGFPPPTPERVQRALDRVAAIREGIRRRGVDDRVAAIREGIRRRGVDDRVAAIREGIRRRGVDLSQLPDPVEELVKARDAGGWD